MTEQTEETTLERIWRVRQEISAEHDHDPRKLVDHYVRLQEQWRDRLVPVDEPGDRTGESAA